MSDEFSATLHRIDPDTNRVSRVISVGSTPRGIAAAGSGVWVAARPFAAAGHRGGTLTEVSKYLPGPDPAQALGSVGMPALATVYDGLVAFRKTDGALGGTLVPDLAVTLPRPAGGGTAYTFTLRRELRYSNGTPVRASDFRRGIQRQLSFGASPAYYEGILGGQACSLHPRRCDLHAGIVTNDAAGTITFRLGQADPDFLYKLALVLAAPAPSGAPGHLIDRAPFLPGTGPYMISQYRPDSSLTLVRNPHFRQWSYAAQPAGYPNVIRFEQMTDLQQQQSALPAPTAASSVLPPPRLFSSWASPGGPDRPVFSPVCTKMRNASAVAASWSERSAGAAPGIAPLTVSVTSPLIVFRLCGGYRSADDLGSAPGARNLSEHGIPRPFLSHRVGSDAVTGNTMRRGHGSSSEAGSVRPQ